MAWVGLWFWPVALSPVGFVLLLFPDGRPPSHRWRVVAWCQSAALLGLFISLAFMPGPMVTAGYEYLDNPLGIEELGPVLGPVGGDLRSAAAGDDRCFGGIPYRSFPPRRSWRTPTTRVVGVCGHASHSCDLRDALARGSSWR